MEKMEGKGRRGGGGEGRRVGWAGKEGDGDGEGKGRVVTETFQALNYQVYVPLRLGGVVAMQNNRSSLGYDSLWSVDAKQQ